MSKKILCYCSWNGYGHIARAYSLAKFIDNVEIIICSPQPYIFPLKKNVRYVNMTEPQSRYRFEGEKIVRQEYHDTIDVESYRKHVLEFFKLLDEIHPDLVIVDNPAEIAIYSMLMGYRTLIVYETLKSNDLRWRLSWGNVERVIVPYTKEFSEEIDYRFADNSFFSGGYSRFEADELPNRIATRKELDIKDSEKLCLITMGKARLGEKIIPEIIKSVVNNKSIKVLMPYFAEDDWINGLKKKFPELMVIHNQTDLRKFYVAADLVLTGAGYNSVMECFEFRVPAILFPLDRVYGEQSNKAVVTKKMGAAEIINVNQTGWSSKIKPLINKVLEPKNTNKMKRAQAKIVDGQGARRLANYITQLIEV